MRYNISATVSGDQLGEALNSLHRFTQTVGVSLVEASALNGAHTTTAVARQTTTTPEQVIKPVKVKRHKRKAPTTKRDGKLQEAAIEIINQFGTGPLRLADIRAKSLAAGITDPTLYRAIRLEIAAGRLTKLGQGMYQRKGASFAQAFGLGH